MTNPMRAGNLIAQAAIAIWLLACIGCADSLTTFRRRRLASPTSILEIEATHPLVNPLRAGARCRPSAGHQVYPALPGVRFAGASAAPARHRRGWLRRPPVLP